MSSNCSVLVRIFIIGLEETGRQLIISLLPPSGSTIALHATRCQ